MSLKGFHVLLISLSSILALAFGGWSVRAWIATDAVSHLALAVFSFAVGAGLIVYVLWFYRKVRTRAVALLAVCWLVAASRPAAACSVCYGGAEGAMIDAARLGVWLLFGLVFAVQLCLVWFFVYLRRKARRLETRGASLS